MTFFKTYQHYVDLWKTIINPYFIDYFIHITGVDNFTLSRLSTVDINVEKLSTSFPLEKDVEKCGKLSNMR